MEENEIQTNVSGNDGVNANYDALAALKELKSKTVSKEDYEKLQKQHSELLQTFVNGGTLQNEDVEEKLSINELRAATFKSGITNIEVVKNALRLREALLEAGEPDPFIPQGSKIVPTDEDIEAANRVADVFKDCIDKAEGDSMIFTNELQRRTIDVMPNRRK